jgi:methionyl-tRNA synthetase
MSKSVGNVVDPFPLVKDCGPDRLRYFLFREVRFGEDGNFSREALKNRISYDLANDLGNLVQRVLAFIQKLGGQLVANYNFTEKERILFENARGLTAEMRPLIDRQDLYGVLGAVWNLVTESNKFVNDAEPWKLIGTDPVRLNVILTALCESIRAIGFGISPFMPDTADKIFRFMNIAGRSFDEINIDFVPQQFPVPFPLFPKED